MTLNTLRIKVTLLALTLILLSGTIGQTALAEEGAIRIAGQTVFVNKASSGGLSADQRASTIQNNLDNALVAANDRSPASVSIVYVKGIPVITLGNYQVVTVDSDNAKLAGTTPAVLAQRWADSLKNVLADKASVDSYVSQLTGAYQASSPVTKGNQSSSSSYASWPQQNNAQQPPYQQPPQYGGQQPPSYDNAQNAEQYNRNTPPGYPVQRGRVVYAPAGLVMNATLNTSIATQAARPGDLIQASLSQPVLVGDAQIPMGSLLIGTVTEAKSGGFFGRAGTLSIKFNRLRTPDGAETPISGNLHGGIGKYADKNDVLAGETWKTKLGQGAIRGAVGAGTGAALGTAVGAIAGGGRGAGMGAWSGTAIGAGIGLADSLLLRKGKDVDLPSGSPLQVQLEAPVSLTVGNQSPYGTF